MPRSRPIGALEVSEFLTTSSVAPSGRDADDGDTYGHTPVPRMFDAADVYGIGYDSDRAGRAPLRLGFIGAGGVVQSKWLPALLRLRTLWDPVELVGVADPSEAQGRKIERLYGCRWYPDHRQLLADARPQAVVVASPDDFHGGHARAALESGAATLVEKPFCTSLIEARDLCQLAGGRQLVLMAVGNLRYSPPFRRARQLVRDLEGFRAPGLLIGKMHLGYDYVDLLEDATVHLFDLARFFMGEVVAVEAHSVAPRAEGLRHPYPFRQAAITLGFSSGSVAQLSTSSSALSLKPWLRVEVYGEGVWLAVDDVFQLTLYDSETGPSKSWRPVLANTLLFDEEFGGYLPQIEHFLQVVRGDEQAGITGQDGYKALELVVAAHLAIARSEAVPLPLDPERAANELARLRARW
jgi:predicted dehydrogenase